METNLCKPYRECTIYKLTQGYSDAHRAFDFAGNWGTWLVPMENCIVENIMDAQMLDNGWEYDRGFGILLRSTANPEIKYSYWHCMPFFPVKKGEVVLQGQPIAQMANSGYCISGGQVVQYKDKLKPPYPGTHVHLSCPEDTIKRIDWNIPVEFSVMTAISLTLFSISNFIKNHL